MCGPTCTSKRVMRHTSEHMAKSWSPNPIKEKFNSPADAIATPELMRRTMASCNVDTCSLPMANAMTNIITGVMLLII